MSTVLITGKTGLIGSEIEKILLEKGYNIHYLTTSKNKIINTASCKGFYWNPNRKEIDVNCLTNVDYIIHLAGSTVAKKWTKAYKQEILNSRIQSAELLLDTLKNNSHNVKQIISASAIGIYPSHFTKEYTENEKTTNPYFLGEVVKAWEQSADNFNNLGITVTKVRIGLVLAKNGGALPEMVKPIQFGFGAILGNGKQMQSWIHYHDLAQIFVFLLENNLSGTFNGVAPHPIDNEHLTQKIAKILNKPLWLPAVPKFVLQFILGEMHTLLFDSQKVSAQKIITSGFTFKFEFAEKALKDLLKKD